MTMTFVEKNGVLTYVKTKRIYIAGPMSGYEDFNYPAFHEAEAQLKAVGYGVYNPANNEGLNPTPGVWQSKEWYMRKALPLVLRADGVALLPGWGRSRGARLEAQVAEAIGIKAIDLWWWLEREKSKDTYLGWDSVGCGTEEGK